jgi:hypothetical protein
MKTFHWMFHCAVAAILVVFQANGAVQVSPGPESEPQTGATPAVPAGATEKSVAFQVGAKFLTANSGGALDLSGMKIGSKQIFKMFDLNGGELADGDEVKIQYIPGKGSAGGSGDVSKSSFWMETPLGVRRSRPGESFKVKQVGTKYAFQNLKGKFVGQPGEEGNLSLVEKQEAALLVDIIDLSNGVPKAPKAPKAPKPEASEAAAPAPAEKAPAE